MWRESARKEYVAFGRCGDRDLYMICAEIECRSSENAAVADQGKGFITVDVVAIDVSLLSVGNERSEATRREEKKREGCAASHSPRSYIRTSHPW